MKLAPLVSGIALALGMVMSSGDASAAGVALDSSELTLKVRGDLKLEIDKARVATPELFKSVADIASRAKELDSQSRLPGAPLTLHFKPLGNRALFPMLEALAFDAHTPKDLPATASTALKLGLIEAIGAIRDPQAIPVLSKLVEQDKPETARAAAEGLSRIGTDEALGAVISAAVKARAASPVQERAILSGMHDARRESAAKFLAKRLGENPDAETARTIVKALGGVGNAWAWKTLPNQAEAAATRALTASVLVDAFVKFTGDTRESAAKSLLVVDDASTPALIVSAKAKASPEVAAELSKLETRFANNPAR